MTKNIALIIASAALGMLAYYLTGTLWASFALGLLLGLLA